MRETTWDVSEVTYGTKDVSCFVGVDGTEGGKDSEVQEEWES